MSLRMFLVVVSLIVVGVQGSSINRNCPTPPSVYNGAYVLINGTGRESAYLQCDPGFSPTPATTIKCRCRKWVIPNPAPICQTPSSMGTTFVAVFLLPTSYTGQGIEAQTLTITTEGTANVNIRSISESNAIDVVVNSSEDVEYSTGLVLNEAKAVTNKVLVITSDVDISVRALTYRKGKAVGADSYLLHPTNNLSNQYIVMTAASKSQLAVIAIENDTSVEIVSASGAPVYSGTLQQYQVYSYRKNIDLTGYMVSTNNNAAVFSGHNFAVVPQELTGSKDVGFVQMLGVQYFYNECIMGPLLPDDVYELKVVASVSGTIINILINGIITTINLNAYENYRYTVDDGFAVKISATNPIMVAQYSLTSSATHRALGDVSMVQCLDSNKFLNNYKFTLYSSSLFGNDRFVRITILQSDTAQLQLNGTPFAADSTINISNYSILYKELDAGSTYTLTTLNGRTFGCDIYATDRVIQHISNCGLIL